MPVSRGLPLIVVYALYYAILLYGRWVFDVLTESAGGCVRARMCVCARPRSRIQRDVRVYLHITRVKIRDGSYIRIYVYTRARVLPPNVYPYDRGSQILRLFTPVASLRPARYNGIFYHLAQQQQHLAADRNVFLGSREMYGNYIFKTRLCYSQGSENIERESWL